MNQGLIHHEDFCVPKGKSQHSHAARTQKWASRILLPMYIRTEDEKEAKEDSFPNLVIMQLIGDVETSRNLISLSQSCSNIQIEREKRRKATLGQ